MTPAEQRLERADAVLLEIEQRLVEQLELAALEREAEIGLELAALLRALVEALFEEGDRCRGRPPWRDRARGRRCAAGCSPSLAVLRAQWRCRCWSTARTRCRRSLSGCAHCGEDVARQPVDRVAVARRRSAARRTRRRRAARRNGRARPAARDAPASTSSASPAGWPSVSLIDLELVEVEAVEREQAPLPSAARNRWSSCCWNIVRLGRPVSTSLKASWVMRCSRSAILPTISLKLLASRASSSLPRTATWTCSPEASRPAASSSARQRLGDPRAPPSMSRSRRAAARAAS